MQLASRLMLVRPVAFGYNTETAETNAFQQHIADFDKAQIQQKAVSEFNHFVDLLQAHEINTDVFDDEPGDPLPDAVFPNNWISFHEDGVMVLYPMCARSRRKERRQQIIAYYQQAGYRVEDWTGFENKNKYLEGTGSLVLDRDHKIAYACLSPRTHKKLVKQFAKMRGYKPEIFEAYDHKNISIYHTNVMMAVGEDFAVVAGKAVRDTKKRAGIFDLLEKTGKEVINLSFEQLNHYAGNILQVKNKNGEKRIILSQNAYDSLYKIQVKKMQKYGKMIVPELDTIERLGGGSARCMVTEVF